MARAISDLLITHQLVETKRTAVFDNLDKRLNKLVHDVYGSTWSREIMEAKWFRQLNC